jgi:hypothetical protein
MAFEAPTLLQGGDQGPHPQPSTHARATFPEHASAGGTCRTDERSAEERDITREMDAQELRRRHAELREAYARLRAAAGLPLQVTRVPPVESSRWPDFYRTRWPSPRDLLAAFLCAGLGLGLACWHHGRQQRVTRRVGATAPALTRPWPGADPTAVVPPHQGWARGSGAGRDSLYHPPP